MSMSYFLRTINKVRERFFAMAHYSQGEILRSMGEETITRLREELDQQWPVACQDAAIAKLLSDGADRDGVLEWFIAQVRQKVNAAFRHQQKGRLHLVDLKIDSRPAGTAITSFLDEEYEFDVSGQTRISGLAVVGGYAVQLTPLFVSHPFYQYRAITSVVMKTVKRRAKAAKKAGRS
jgi:hypothetical protein